MATDNLSYPQSHSVSKTYKLNSKIFIFSILLLAFFSLGVVNGAECGTVPVANCYISGNQNIQWNNGIYSINSTGNNGVRIKGSNITLDCNGSSIIGNHSDILSVGIVSDSSDYQNVTIKNCIISGYGYGIYYYTSVNLTFDNITMYDNNQSFRLSNINGFSIINSNLSDSIERALDGTSLYPNVYIYGGSINGLINNNFITGENAVNIVASNLTIIHGNFISNSQPYGIHIDYNSFYNNLTNNYILNSGWDGLEIRSSNTYVAYNEVNNSQHHALDFYTNPILQSVQNGNLVEYNRFYRTINDSFSNPYSHYVYLYKASENIIRHNIFYGGTAGKGGGIVFQGLSGYESKNNYIFNNSFLDINAPGQLIYLSDSYNNTLVNNSYSGGNTNWLQFGNYNSANNTINDFDFPNVFTNGFYQGSSNKTKNYLYFINNNNSYSSVLKLSTFTSSLCINSTGSICNGSSSNIALNTGQVNITLNPNEEAYVLDSFNCSESAQASTGMPCGREKSPINITGVISGINTRSYAISSTISQNVTFPIYLFADCTKNILPTITPKGKEPYTSTNYSCKNGILSIYDAHLEESSSSNVITLTFSKMDSNTCNSITNMSFGANLLGLLIVGAFGMFVLLVFIKSDESDKIWQTIGAKNSSQFMIIIILVGIIIIIGTFIASMISALGC